MIAMYSKLVTKFCFILLLFFVQFNLQGQVNIDYSKYSCKKNKLPISLVLKAQQRTISAASNNTDFQYQFCDWTVDPAVRYIAGSILTRFKARTNISQIEFDLNAPLVVDSVFWLNGATSTPLTYTHTSGLVTCNFPSTITTNTISHVKVYYHGVPISTGYGSFYTGTHGPSSTPVLWTLSEPYGAMDWWPCKQTLNDKLDSVRVHVTCPSAYTVASNGLLESTTVNGSNTVHKWIHKYPIAAYLVAINVTNFSHYTENVTINSQNLPIENYVYPENLSSFQTGTALLPIVMQYYSTQFEPYPFLNEKYGHAQFGWGGGMEHQSMTFVYNSSFDLLAHELAHQWFGDKITCGTWQDIWLNEGFATYLTGLTNEQGFPGSTSWAAWKSGVMANIVSQPSGSVQVPAADTLNVGRVFDSRLTYNKGAYLLHMLRWKLDSVPFFTGIRNYMADAGIAYNYALTTQLKSYLEAASGQNLTEFFNDWFYNQGYPTYTITWFQNTTTNSTQIKINQTQSHPSVSYFEMPLPIRIQNPSLNKDTTIVVNNTSNGQVFTIPLGFQVNSVEFDPKFWVLNRRSDLQILNSSSPFPLELIDFNVVKEYKKHIISFQLENSGNDISDIIIEKSNDGKLFQKIEHIKIEKDKNQYTASDKEPFAHNYYRLSWLNNKTNALAYSKVIYIQGDDENNLVNNAYPNPCYQKMHLILNENIHTYQYKIINNLGIEIQRGTWENNSLQDLNTSLLSNGNYKLIVSSDDFVNSQIIPFVKNGL